MADRRDAATALKLTPELEGFIQGGVPNKQPTGKIAAAETTENEEHATEAERQCCGTTQETATS